MVIMLDVRDLVQQIPLGARPASGAKVTEGRTLTGNTGPLAYGKRICQGADGSIFRQQP